MNFGGAKMIKIKVIHKIFIIFLCAAFLFLTLLNPNASKCGITSGLLLCGNVIIPSLFPFMVFSQLLYNVINQFRFEKIKVFLFKVFKLDFNNLLIFFTSMIGGYPVGAKLINNAYIDKQISRHNAEILLPICVNAGPSFVVIAIGAAMLNSTVLGTILFFSELIACIELYLIFRKELNTDNISVKEPIRRSFSEIFVDSVADSCASIINICAFTATFSCIINVLKTIIKNKILISVITYPLEVSNTALNNKNIYLLAFIIGFGGICVIFQIISISKSFYKDIGKMLLVRIIHGVFTVINTYAILKIFKITAPTISNIGNNVLNISNNNIKISMILIFLALLLLISISYKKYSGSLKKDIL